MNSIALTVGFASILFDGLPPFEETSARKLWKMEAGAPYDYAYSGDFVRELSKRTDLAQYKISIQTHNAAGDQVMHETLAFQRK